MEPSVDVHHLAEDARKLQRDRVPVDVVVRQIHQVVYSTSLDVLHHQYPFPRFLDLGYERISDGDRIQCVKGSAHECTTTSSRSQSPPQPAQRCAARAQSPSAFARGCNTELCDTEDSGDDDESDDGDGLTGVQVEEPAPTRLTR